MLLGVVGALVVAGGIVFFQQRAQSPAPAGAAQAAAEDAASAQASSASQPGAEAGAAVASQSAASAGGQGAAGAAAPPAAHGAARTVGQPVQGASAHHASAGAAGKGSHPGAAKKEPPNVVVGSRRRQDDVPSKRVALGDLNLSTQLGACTALKRIMRAADDVCPFADERPLDLRRQHRECQQDAVARAVHDTRSKKLESVYAKRSEGC